MVAKSRRLKIGIKSATMPPEATISDAMISATIKQRQGALGGLSLDEMTNAAAAVTSRPLVVRFGAMGDMVMITSLLRALSSRYGSPVDVLSSGGWTRPLLAGQPGVGEIYLLKNRSLPFLINPHQRELATLLRRRGAGPTWYCDHDNKCLRLLQQAGTGPDLLCTARDLAMLDGEHLLDYWRRFAALTPRAAEPGPGVMTWEDPTLLVPPKAAEELDQWLAGRGLAGRQLLLVQPGNKRTMRRGLRQRPSNTKWWPETRWAAVLQGLSAMHPKAAILMLGVPQEHDLNEQIIALAQVRNVVNLACDLPIPRLLALQARASAMVSVDTGPAHSATAVGCPVLVLFGVADPARIRPRNGSVPVRHLVGRGSDGPSILGITVEQVLTGWQALPKR
jgi:ADP-heptose:LPS heptosyltransferase